MNTEPCGFCRKGTIGVGRMATKCMVCKGEGVRPQGPPGIQYEYGQPCAWCDRRAERECPVTTDGLREDGSYKRGIRVLVCSDHYDKIEKAPKPKRIPAGTNQMDIFEAGA